MVQPRADARSSSHPTTCARTSSGPTTSARCTMASSHVRNASRLPHGTANSVDPSRCRESTARGPISRSTVGAMSASTRTRAVVPSPSSSLSVFTARARSRPAGRDTLLGPVTTARPSMRSTRNTRWSPRRWSCPTRYQRPPRHSSPNGSTDRSSPWYLNLTDCWRSTPSESASSASSPIVRSTEVVVPSRRSPPSFHSASVPARAPIRTVASASCSASCSSGLRRRSASSYSRRSTEYADSPAWSPPRTTVRIGTPSDRSTDLSRSNFARAAWSEPG
jgi:hypothetical protein